VSRPVLELLAAYAPEYPCLFSGVVALQPRAEQSFASGRMHITLEATIDSGKFEPGRDSPVYGAHNGPNCRGLPSPGTPAPEVPINDGYDYSGARTGLPGLPKLPGLNDALASLPQPATSFSGSEMGFAGTAAEQAVLRPVLAAATGVPASEVSDFALLMWGPLMRGAVVNVA
jgi:phospholipid/cholesterol/gamma-HCH transport system substrate-binding protein